MHCAGTFREVSVQALFDTAAQANFVSSVFLAKANIYMVPNDCNSTVATAANGTPVVVSGMVRCCMKLQGHTSTVVCRVADLDTSIPLILGEP